MRDIQISMVICALGLLANTPFLNAGESGEWTIDDIVTAESAGSWTLSRDGTLAAWTKTTIEKIDGEEKRISRLWLTRLTTNESVQLTRGDNSVRSPQFSIDGTRLAFITPRKRPGGGDSGEKGGGDEAKSQIWIIPVNGGEAWPVTKLDRGAKSYAWADDETLIVLAQESPTLWEKQRKKKKDTSIVVEDARREPPVRLFRIAIKGGKATRITSNLDWISSMTVSPDGKHAVISAQQSLSYQFDEKVPPHTRLVDLETGESQRLYEGTRLVPGRVQWTPDSAGFYFLNRYSSHPIYRVATISELYYHDLESARHAKVDLAWERGVGGGYQALSDGAIVLLANGVRYQSVRLKRDGNIWTRVNLTGEHVPNLDSITVSHSGTGVVYRHTTGTTPPQFFSAKLEDAQLVDSRQITELNPDFADKPKGNVTVISWTGANDEEIEGILHYPLDYEKGKRYPLLLNPHGGPAGTSRDVWSHSWASPRILWRQAGAFVLEPNYHGSAGYGLAFVESIGQGKYYELETPDLINGVDYLITMGIVDPDRLGIVGWSNGGILAAELITRSTRWKVASVGAADVEWISDWANVDFGASFDNYYFGASPLEDPDLYIRKSPFFRLGEVTTPTIIFTGTEDRNVPPHQSWSLFRALQQLEKAPARLVLFPGEPHGLRKIAHQRRKIEEDMAWFDEYLFKSGEETNDAIKDGSPLEALIALKKASKIGSWYGIQISDTLIPEVVEHDDLLVGRFEVTRFQFRAYDPMYGVTPDKGNFPVSGITFAKAQSYVKWLSEKTGETYRLPTREEAEQFSKSAGTGGNTLDHWAGYTPNPEDVEKLIASIGNMVGDAPLLREVGVGHGSGDPAVYDLDGNVAEWAIDEDGSGVLIGASADRPSRIRDRTADAGPAYRGFRVIKGVKAEED